MVTGIVILNYNNVRDTVACVDSIIKYNTAEVVVVVVDNGSLDMSGAKLEKELSERFVCFQTATPGATTLLDVVGSCTLILSTTNEGYARGNNIGIEYILRMSCVSSVLVLNNDVLFIEDIIPRLNEVLNQVDSVGVVSPILVNENGKDIRYSCARKNHSINEIFLNAMFLMKDPLGVVEKLKNKRLILKGRDISTLPELIQIELPSGSCMLMKKNVVKELGGFDSNTFLYFEENILFKKLQAINLTNYLVTELRCVHLGGNSISKIPNVQMQKHSLESAFYYMKAYEHINLFKQWLFKGMIRVNIGLRKVLDK